MKSWEEYLQKICSKYLLLGSRISVDWPALSDFYIRACTFCILKGNSKLEKLTKMVGDPIQALLPVELPDYSK